MSQYYPIPQPTIAANILVRRERRLPVPGEVRVRAGQRVEPSDVVAQSVPSFDPVVVGIAADLDMSPAAAAKRLRVSPGQAVEQGDMLAQKGGRGSRVSRSPVTGTFTGYDPATGSGLISIPSETVSVHAHLKGIVTDLIPYYGAVIETPATVIRGIFGLGGEQHGVLKVLVADNDEPVTPEVINARVTYSVALGGSEVTVAALHKLIQLGARGLITGSIRQSELAAFLGYSGPEAWRLGASTLNSNGWVFPPPLPGKVTPVPPDFVLIITEGFGSVPMSPRTFETIAGYDGQEIAVDGSTRLRGGLARPEIVIPLARTTNVEWLEESGPRLEVGKNVRLLAPAYLGQIAQVISLPVGPRAVQSGVLSTVAEVQMAGGQRLRVPTANLEVLE